jgi:tellurite methyltransferase
LNDYNPLADTVGSTDIYLIDQIMKGRYQPTDIILDAGCGSGRNLHWFVRQHIGVYGIDGNEETLARARSNYPSLEDNRLQQSPVEKLPFQDEYFNHVISSAVLHFAKDILHFNAMVAEMVRVLRPGGSLFIRMTSDIGIGDRVRLIGNGIYQIPDGSRRFLLTRPLLADVMDKNKLTFLEPLKTVNVDDIRCMSTLVLARLAI